jgi:ribosomal protein S18 acetylase RimI-like enzyme
MLIDFMICIRKAISSDASQIAKLDKIYFKEGISPYREEPFDEEQIKDIIQNYIVFVAEESSKLIGFIALQEKTTGLGAKSRDLKAGESYIELDSLYVVSTKRSKNIEQLLLKNALSEAKTQGLNKIRFVVDHKNQDAQIKFFEKFGGERMWTFMKIDL